MLTDKTGTLTQNVMVFKQCVVGGKSYGTLDDVKFADEQLNVDFNRSTKVGGIVLSEKSFLLLQADNVIYRNFLLSLGICHTVVPDLPSTTSASVDENDDGNVAPGTSRKVATPSAEEYPRIVYQASSPDEGALVRGARDVGVVFHTRTPRVITVNFFGEDETYELLCVTEFSSNRKRMGVVYKCPDGVIRLFVKGADNIIYERLSEESAYKYHTTKLLENFAASGLRTLCFAYREIPVNEYENWAKIFHEATVALVDREQKLEDVAELIEKDLLLLGATAIEDKLQEVKRIFHAAL